MRVKSSFFILYSVVLFAFSLYAEASDSIEWSPYNVGKTKAQKASEVLFIHFYADWCGFCRKMAKETFRDPHVVRYLNEHFTSVLVNTDREKQLSTSFQIQGLPTTVFVRPDGNPISSLPGYVPPKRFLLLLEFIHTKAFEKMTFSAFLERQGRQAGKKKE